MCVHFSGSLLSKGVDMKKKILVVSESVTDAHIFRPAILAGYLDNDQYEIYFASGEIPSYLKNKYPQFHYLQLATCVSKAQFLKTISQGGFPYNREIFQEQVKEDLKFIDQIQPDMILSDFRFSLLISARLKKIPLMTISNIIWSLSSKFSQRVPDLVYNRWFGLEISQFIFRCIRPMLFFLLAYSFNRVAKKYGTPRVKNLMDLFSSGDYVFYADIPNLVDLNPLPQNYKIIGPILPHFSLSNEMRNENAVSEKVKTRQKIIIALGSSGPQQLVEELLESIKDLPLQIYISSSGKNLNIEENEHVHVSPYLILDKELLDTDLVIANGGSPMGYSCLSQGVPFIGITSNMDQCTFTKAIEAKGVAHEIRLSQWNAKKFRKLVCNMLLDEKYKDRARHVQKSIPLQETRQNFLKIFHEIESDHDQKNNQEPRCFKKIIESHIIKNSLSSAFKFKINEDHWDTMNWKSFYQQSLIIAQSLRRLGLKKGDCLAIIAENGIEWEQLFYGSMINGSMVLGIDPRTSEDQKLFMLEHSRASIVVLSKKSSLKVIPQRVLDQLTHIIVLESCQHQAMNHNSVLLFSDLKIIGEEPLFLETPSPDTPAFLTYTSGTTGISKGLVYSQRQLIESAYEVIHFFGITQFQNRFLCWLPVANLFQRMLNVCALLLGDEIGFIQDPATLMKNLPILKPTIFIGVPRFYERLYENVQLRLQSCPKIFQPLFLAFLRWKVYKSLGGSIRLMLSGSAPLSIPVLQFMNTLKLQFVEAYGLSECILPIAINRFTREKLGSVGPLLSKNETKITDEGELLIRGPFVSKSYFCSGDKNRWDEEGFFHTGDLVFQDQEGFFYIQGRKSDLIKLSNGRRIAPLSIEKAFQSIPLVDASVVVGHGRKSLAVIITLNKKMDQLSAEECEKFERDLLNVTQNFPSYEQVKNFLILKDSFSVEAGHLTDNLKLKRAAIEKMYQKDLEILYGEALTNSSNFIDSRASFLVFKP